MTIDEDDFDVAQLKSTQTPVEVGLDAVVEADELEDELENEPDDEEHHTPSG